MYRVPAFSIRGNSVEDARLVNIMLSGDADNLRIIVNRLDGQRRGIQRSLSKTRKRLDALEGQLTLNEFLEAGTNPEPAVRTVSKFD